MKIHRGILAAVTLTALMAMAGCHSYHVEVAVENHTGGTIQLLEVDYPERQLRGQHAGGGRGVPLSHPVARQRANQSAVHGNRRAAEPSGRAHVVRAAGGPDGDRTAARRESGVSSRSDGRGRQGQVNRGGIDSLEFSICSTLKSCKSTGKMSFLAVLCPYTTDTKNQRATMQGRVVSSAGQQHIRWLLKYGYARHLGTCFLPGHAGRCFRGPSRAERERGRPDLDGERAAACLPFAGSPLALARLSAHRFSSPGNWQLAHPRNLGVEPAAQRAGRRRNPDGRSICCGGVRRSFRASRNLHICFASSDLPFLPLP